MTTPWVTSLVAPPLLCLVVTLTARRRTRLRADVGLARRNRAKRNARTAIARALRREDEGVKLQGLCEALTGYLADRFNLPPGTLTPSEVRALLNARARFGPHDPSPDREEGGRRGSPRGGLAHAGLDANRSPKTRASDVTESIVAFLEECDARKWTHQVRRAGGQEDADTGADSGDQWSPGMAAGKVREWIRQIERATR